MRRRGLGLVIFSFMVLAAGLPVSAQPKTMKDGTVFDAEYYANTYADVKEVFGNNEVELYNHYVQYGKKEGRLPCAENAKNTNSIKSLIDNFDAEYYAKNNPDVVAALGDDEDILYKHYLEYGKKEGRIPNNSTKASVDSVKKTENKTTVKTNNKSTVTIPKQNEKKGILVWVPVNGGTKYHNSSGCSNMEDPMQVSIETAKSNGYTACKRCYK